MSISKITCKDVTFSVAYLLLELCAIGSFLLAIFALFDSFYYQKGSGLRGRASIEVDYGYQYLTYNMKIELAHQTLTNYTDSIYWYDAYDTYCVPYDTADYCDDLKKMDDNENFLTICFGIAVVSIWLVIGGGMFCGCCVCKSCSDKCKHRCQVFSNLCNVTLCAGSVIGYVIFLYTFAHTFTSSEDGINEFVTIFIPLNNITWDNIKYGNSIYLFGGACLCSFISLLMALFVTIKGEKFVTRGNKDNKNNASLINNDSIDNYNATSVTIGNNNDNNGNNSNNNFVDNNSEGIPTYKVINNQNNQSIGVGTTGTSYAKI